jgi:hypothetical protein
MPESADATVECPCCGYIETYEITAVKYEEETISRQTCSSCKKPFFLSVQLHVIAETYPLVEPQTKSTG